MPHRSSKSVVLLSGGLDSAVAGACARADGHEVHAVTIDYGQRHRVELEAAKRVAAQLEVREHRVIAVDLRAVGGSALTAGIGVPKDRIHEGDAPGAEIPVTYVPARNLLFLSLATGYAEVIGASDLYIGVNAVDYSGYPDCRAEFIRSFERTVNLGTKAGAEGRPLRVRTPLVDLSKAGIIRLGARLGVDLSLTHSCYDPDASSNACGRCDSCLLRRRGFEEAGVPDPAAAGSGSA